LSASFSSIKQLSQSTGNRSQAFTILEVMVAASLIALSIGSIAAMNVRSFHILRASREAAASSQVLQQRIEMIRDRSWAEVSSSAAMAALLAAPAESEAELTDAGFIETMTVTVPEASASGPVESSRAFKVRRSRGTVVVKQAEDFSAEPTLFFEGSVTWTDHSGPHQRSLRTVVCRIGLTRGGVVGSVVGRPGTGKSGP
jgi:Tfp pilus assembly protein PilV